MQSEQHVTVFLRQFHQCKPGPRLPSICMLTTVDPQERSTWRSGVRSAMPVMLASYLERDPLMLMMPLHLNVNQKSHYDVMI